MKIKRKAPNLADERFGSYSMGCRNRRARRVKWAFYPSRLGSKPDGGLVIPWEMEKRGLSLFHSIDTGLGTQKV
jgi:hypothetical protein